MLRAGSRYRPWSGPALFSAGFRPFFLLAGIWAALALPLWLVMLGGHLGLPSVFDPVAWHTHEMLFGFVQAAVAGILLTAVPNWTGRMPIRAGALLDSRRSSWRAVWPSPSRA
jgi:uncharacterized protein involved in response to NO